MLGDAFITLPARMVNAISEKVLEWLTALVNPFLEKRVGMPRVSYEIFCTLSEMRANYYDASSSWREVRMVGGVESHKRTHADIHVVQTLFVGGGLPSSFYTTVAGSR